MDDAVGSHFPIKIKLKNGEERIVGSAHDLPEGESFLIVATRVKCDLDRLKDDIEDFFIHEFLERGTTWDQLRSVMISLACEPDPREKEK